MFSSKKVLWISICQFLLQLLWPTHNTLYRNIWSPTKTSQSNSIYGVVAAWFRQGTLSIDCLKGLADQGQWLSCEVAASCKDLQAPKSCHWKLLYLCIWYLFTLALFCFHFSDLLKIAFTDTSTLLNCTWNFQATSSWSSFTRTNPPALYTTYRRIDINTWCLLQRVAEILCLGISTKFGGTNCIIHSHWFLCLRADRNHSPSAAATCSLKGKNSGEYLPSPRIANNMFTQLVHVQHGTPAQSEIIVICDFPSWQS